MLIRLVTAIKNSKLVPVFSHPPIALKCLQSHSVLLNILPSQCLADRFELGVATVFFLRELSLFFLRIKLNNTTVALILRVLQI